MLSAVLYFSTGEHQEAGSCTFSHFLNMVIDTDLQLEVWAAHL